MLSAGPQLVKVGGSGPLRGMPRAEPQPNAAMPYYTKIVKVIAAATYLAWWLG